jgi:isochorismate pyruvate lyase
MTKPRGGKPDAPGSSAEGGSGLEPWETQVGDCRALRIGSHVWVTGATAVRADGRIYGRGDAEAQAERCLEVVGEALMRLGATMEHVVRTRAFVADIVLRDPVLRAHQSCFAEHPPATSLVEVAALTHPDMLVEIEAEAFLPDADAAPPPRGART